MATSTMGVLSAPLDVCVIVMGYLQENSEKHLIKKIENSVYDVFAKIVIKNAVSSVIFLDIDGVLFNNRMDGSIGKMASQLFPNHTGIWKDEQCDIAATHLFDKNALSNLKKLIFNYKNVAIVLSSSWRDYKSVPKLRRIFAALFFSNLIIDKTPDDADEDYQNETPLMSKYFGRGVEIAYWLQKHPSITNFVILDDYDNGLSGGFREQFVQTDAEKLLTDGDIEKARKILDK